MFSYGAALLLGCCIGSTCLLADGMASHVSLLEGGVSLDLATNWFLIGPQKVAKMNAAMGPAQKQAGLRYLAIANRGEPYEGKARLMNAVIVGYVPGFASPDEIVTQFALVRRGAQIAKEEHKKNIQSIDLKTPYLDEQLGVLVIPTEGSTAKAGELGGKTYVLPASTGTVTFMVLCEKSVRSAVIGEFETSLRTLKLRKDLQLGDEWMPRLRQLIRAE